MFFQQHIEITHKKKIDKELFNLLKTVEHTLETFPFKILTFYR